MKKYISIFSVVIAYILCFLINSFETFGMQTSGSILLYIFALKCVFYVLIGLFVPVAAENIKIYRQEFGIKICCLIEVLLPVILWLIFVRQGMLIMNMEHFVLVYFLSIGMMIYSLTAKK